MYKAMIFNVTEVWQNIKLDYFRLFFNLVTSSKAYDVHPLYDIFIISKNDIKIHTVHV